jgi:hypothetical protein
MKLVEPARTRIADRSPVGAHCVADLSAFRPSSADLPAATRVPPSTAEEQEHEQDDDQRGGAHGVVPFLLGMSDCCPTNVARKGPTRPGARVRSKRRAAA